MTRFLTIILLVLMGVTASRADVLPQLKREKPDLDSIRIATLDRTSPYYYPRLKCIFSWPSFSAMILS